MVITKSQLSTLLLVAVVIVVDSVQAGLVFPSSNLNLQLSKVGLWSVSNRTKIKIWASICHRF